MYSDKNFYLSGAPATGNVSSSGTPQTLNSATASIDSTNVFDTGATGGLFDGAKMAFVDIILLDGATNTATGGTTPTLSFTIQDSADNSSWADVVSSKLFAAATWQGSSATGAGSNPPIMRFAIPPTTRRYIKIVYTFGATRGTGSVPVYAVLKAHN